MTVGDKIRERRIELGLSQQKLADLTGYKTRGAINRIESGERHPNPDRLPILCKVLELDLNDLYDVKSFNHPEIEIGHAIYEAVGELEKKEIEDLIKYAKRKGFGKK